MSRGRRVWSPAISTGSTNSASRLINFYEGAAGGRVRKGQKERHGGKHRVEKEATERHLQFAKIFRHPFLDGIHRVINFSTLARFRLQVPLQDISEKTIR